MHPKRATFMIAALLFWVLMVNLMPGFKIGIGVIKEAQKWHQRSTAITQTYEK